MKKKKLKKKIKHLETMIEHMECRCDNWAMVARETRDNTTKYSTKINQLNADIANCCRIINDHASRLAANRFSIDDIYEKLGILKLRTETDYTSFSKKETKNDEKTCDTCKWKPLMEQGGQDIPCMGCTANDKKMWKSKET